MEDGWSIFRVEIWEVEEEMCGATRIREGMRRKGSGWWVEQIKRIFERN